MYSWNICADVCSFNPIHWVFWLIPGWQAPMQYW